MPPANPDFEGGAGFADKRGVIVTGDTGAARALIITGDRGLFDREGGIRALPGTGIEADAIKRDYPRALVFTGAQAQEALFKRQAEKCRFLRLAAHGVVDDTNPLLSSIILA